MGAACTSNQKVSQNEPILVVNRRRNQQQRNTQNSNFPNFQNSNQNQQFRSHNSRPPISQQQQQQQQQQKKRSQSVQIEKPIQCFSIEKFKLDENQLQNQNLICCICLQVVKYAVQDPCGHIFGKACIHKWVKKSGYCPFSRNALTIQQLQPNMQKREEVFYAIKDEYKKVPQDTKKTEQQKAEEINKQKERRMSEIRRKSLEPQQRRATIMAASNQTQTTTSTYHRNQQQNENNINSNNYSNSNSQQHNESMEQPQQQQQNQIQQLVECP